MPLLETDRTRDFATSDGAAIYAVWPQPMRKNISVLRALIFEPADRVPEAELGHFIAMALTYHLKAGSNKL